MRFDEASGGHESVPEDWTSPTKMRALFLDDPCILWLEYHGHKFGFTKDPELHSFLSFVGEMGNRFEDEWVKRMAPDAVRAMERDWGVRNVEGLRRTIRLMEAGCPVITKAALWWAPERIYGTADLIVRTSWLGERFPHLRPLLSGPDHYVAIDAKFTRNLTSASKSTDLRMYTAQLQFYSLMLAGIQGHLPRQGFLVTRDQISQPLPIDLGLKPGQPLDPNLVQMCERHQDIMKRGESYLPWRDEIVRPNFGNAKDEPWHGAKKKIAELIPGGPMERLPHIGSHHRTELQAHGITCLEDLLCPDAANLPFEMLSGIGYATAKRIREVLRANRTGKASDVRDTLVPPRCEFSGYVDMEFFSDIHVDYEKDWPQLKGCPMIFMIGIGWEERGKWRFRKFVAEREDCAAEKKLFDDFLSFLAQKGVFDPNRSAALYHWSQAEVWQSASAALRHGLERLAGLPWVDLRQVFVRGNIAIPGSWGLGIKEVVNALSDYAPEYRSPWPQDLSSGLSAMVMGWKAYEQAEPLDTLEMKTLTEYLEADVKGLWQVLRWLRDPSSAKTASCPAQNRRSGWYAMARAG